MAPIDTKKGKSKFTQKEGKWVKSKKSVAGVQKKRKWTPDSKVFKGSVKEGQGFALKRKEKIKHEYNKLLRKERKKTTGSTSLYKDEYPEHLRHLYMAEAEKLKNEEWTNRVNRSKMRIKNQETVEEPAESDAQEQLTTEAAGLDPETAGTAELTDSVSEKPESTTATAKESLPMSNRLKKKLLKQTSYQKTKEEYERIREKRRKKKEEFLKNKRQREEAIQKYNQKKMETFQMLSKKTKKGQPNLNLQMEYLLQKIQSARK
ncbi:unnamed protein product [Lampetra planeri]